MKITFIRPNMVEERSADAMQPLAFAALSAETPADVETELFDECIEPVPLDLETDLVALSAHTFSARRAYQIADRFRNRGIPVVMGGYHPTFLPEEALEHADAVVVGPAEGQWRGVVEDAGKHRLQRIYRAKSVVPGDRLRYDCRIFQGKRYNPVFPVEFSRGCRFACEFCSVSAFNNFTFQTRPVDRVMEDIEKAGAERILIVDDNVFSHRQEAKRLFERLVPMRIKWGCQISIDVAKDDAMLALMAKSGCIFFLVGFESLRKGNLKQMKKGSNVSCEDCSGAIEKINDHGIMIYASFVFGYDFDTTDVFEETVAFSMKHKFALVNFNTLNPMPGTALYDRLKSEGRLIEERWWLHEKYKYGEVMFRPRQMTPQELKEGCIRARLAFSRYSSILRRAFHRKANSRNMGNLGLYLIANWITRKETRNKMDRIQRENPA